VAEALVYDAWVSHVTGAWTMQVRMEIWKWISELSAFVFVRIVYMDIRIRIRFKMDAKMDVSEFVFQCFSLSDSRSVFDNIRQYPYPQRK
jgi:hypothetical protein